MNIYSKKGDDGKTSSLSGQKVSKNDVMIHFEGAADELNSQLGMVKAMFASADSSLVQFLEDIQKNIMKLMAHVSDVSRDDFHFHGDEVVLLEREIDRLSEKLPEIHQLVIPGENILEAQIHLARTSARKTERMFFAAAEKQSLCSQAGAYLNRLSDYLFILSQTVLSH